MSFDGDQQFNIINAYFIGPKAANLPDFRANINTILDELLETRLDCFPQDNVKRFISKDVRRSKDFRKVRDNFGGAIRKVAQLLGEHSVPFWSPRYQAHMCTDLTMPSLLGYFMTMLYNPNNVALEASPLTTVAELRAGQQLCELFGYNIDEKSKEPLAWGHITCDGTVANLESIWVARNLKFYPLSLAWALEETEELKFIADSFKVPNCKGTSKLFKELSPWELLNLRPETVLGLGDALNKEFGISGEFLQNALENYNIQTIGRHALEEHFEILPMKPKGDNRPSTDGEPTKPYGAMKYMLSKTRHYSWPKGMAVAGLGSNSITEIEVDLNAHLDLVQLEAELRKCAQNGTAVYAVVAIIGSTEEGAVDRLSRILRIRKTLQDELGFSFLVHADAAWGGYFSTMIEASVKQAYRFENDWVPRDPKSSEGLVPALCLKAETEEDLLALKYADSITVDPHKAGYIPYPAGALTYRDGRMRHLVTWSSPYLSQGSSENIGVYGVEGSKPGAAAVSTWLSNKTIGLDPGGYGLLLGEAAYTSARLSVRYATMTEYLLDKSKNEHFICVPFNRLSSEAKDPTNGWLDEPVVNERKWIWENIQGKPNGVISGDPEKMKKLRELGSDLNINCFALNWRYANGKLNDNVEEANYFMKRVVDRLSITSANTEPKKISMYLTSTKFEPHLYGKCAKHFMKRLQVDPVDRDLFVIRNVVMSPFPTQNDFIQDIMGDFQKVVIEEVEKARARNTRSDHIVEFLVQGTETVFLVLQTSFNYATLRQQLIVSADLDALKDEYKKLKGDNPGKTIILKSAEKIDLHQKVDEGSSFEAKVYVKGDEQNAKTGTIQLSDVVKSRPLNYANRDEKYPNQYMPFYLYGTAQEWHISHALLRAPNIALSGSISAFEPALSNVSEADLKAGVILTLPNHRESTMHPFPAKNVNLPGCFFFKAGKKLKVQIWKDPKAGSDNPKGPGLLDDLKDPLYEGEMTLKEVDVDVEGPNEEPVETTDTVDTSKWQEELNHIGNVLNRDYKDPYP
ncbi:hypothetical protein FQN54_003925 [Arachnomyces sp. PD_36]|nr:hypothetical protein FQN54_003925 [Arachnomyces sp. PD_36]